MSTFTFEETEVTIIRCDGEDCDDLFGRHNEDTGFFEDLGGYGPKEWETEAVRHGWVFGSFSRENHALCPFCVVAEYVHYIDGIREWGEKELTEHSAGRK